MNDEKKIKVTIKDTTGYMFTYTVNKKPAWTDDGLIYVISTDKSMIVFNTQNIISYSEKILTAKDSKEKEETSENEEDGV